VSDERKPPEVLLLTDAAPEQRPILAFLRELGCRVDVSNIGAIAVELAWDDQYHLAVVRRIGPPGDLALVLSAMTKNPSRNCAVFLSTNPPPPPIKVDAFFPEPLDMSHFRKATMSLFCQLHLR
jgi:hypothetical protein